MECGGGRTCCAGAVGGDHRDPRRRVLGHDHRRACAPTRPPTARFSGSTTPRTTYTTVNGVAAKGGSLNGPGPVIVDGMVFMNSGYAYLGFGAPGNVLLAFGVE